MGEQMRQGHPNVYIIYQLLLNSKIKVNMFIHLSHPIAHGWNKKLFVQKQIYAEKWKTSETDISIVQ